MSRRSCEVAVVGTGPGGAVAGCLLAEAGKDVLFIEEGAPLPQESCPPFSLQELAQKYRSGGATAALGPAKIAYVEGRVVGGGSEVNSGLYHRVPPAVLALWADRYKIKDACEKDLAPLFERIEKDLALYPSAGPLPAVAAKLSQGAAKLGLEGKEALRLFEADGSSWKRRSMSRTYLPRAHKAGAKLASGLKVVSLRRGANQWLLGCETEEIAAKSVFLACGAIQTPALLRRSGLSADAGRSLALHPMLKAAAEFEENVNGGGCAVAALQVKLPGGGSLGCSAASPSNLALTLAEHDPRAAARWRRFGAYYAMAPGGGTGSVHLLPGFDDPLPRYRLSPEELRCLSEGLKTLCAALFAAGAKAVYPAVAGLAPLRRAADADRLATLDEARLRLTSVHLMASCPMGETAGCVADSFGGVRGQKGLYLCDASALCGPVGVNPQGAVMAFAARNALRFLGKA